MNNPEQQPDPEITLLGLASPEPSHETEIGSIAWFREKMAKRIELTKPTADRVWDISDSGLLWSDPNAGEHYDQLQNHTSYKELVTAPEHRFIQNIVPRVVATLPDKLMFVDLGPGTESKERYFLNAMTEQGKQIVYVPVDINLGMLQRCAESVRGQGIKTMPLHTTFEDLADRLTATDQFRIVVSLGLTFGNYPWEEGLRLLDGIMKKDGAAFVTMQLRERVDIKELQRVYLSPESVKFLRAKLELMGFDEDRDITRYEIDNKINVYAILKNIPEHLQSKGFRVNDRVFLEQTRRPSMEEVKANLDGRYDYSIYDNGSTIIGVVIRPIQKTSGE